MREMDSTFVLSFMCAGFVVVFLILFLAIMLWRWFKHRETMAMIQQGLVPPAQSRPRSNGNGGGKALLAWGIGVLFFGLAVLAAMALFGLMMTDSGVSSGTPALLFLLPGLFILLMGFALVTIYLVTRPTHNGTKLPGDQAESQARQFPDR